ncbi:hypothetical protein HYX12_02965, partial [Candidatus Woesearchaeota archaeon]|nr:hypothetical protein [Candidatus Woesearchaeota archaeon]
MITEKRWIILNIGLGFIAVLLLLAFLEVKLPSVGKVSYFLDPDKPLCVVDWKGELAQWNELDACCLEARNQLDCTTEKAIFQGERLQKVCQTGNGEVLKY